MAQGPVAQALFLGDQTLFNSTRDDCIWKRGNDRDHCPDADITMTLYTSEKSKLKVNHECRLTLDGHQSCAMNSALMASQNIVADFI